MKKIISLLLSFVLAMLIPLQGVAVLAAGKPVISCEDVTCQPGDEITVAVTVQNNPGFSYLEVTPSYDEELTLTHVTNGQLISDFTKGKQYVWVSDEDMTEDGLLMTFTFQVKETVALGTYRVGFIVRTCGNYDEEAVAFTVDEGIVTVKEKSVPVTGVKLNKTSLSLKTGAVETLVATVMPDNATNKAVTWKSGNSAVASVDPSGKVTALKEGNTTITVTTADGSYSASCTVRVVCSHANKTEEPSKSPDCIHCGNHRYFTCRDCGDILKADGITETTIEAETIPALGHDFSERIEDEAHYVAGSGEDCLSVKQYYYDCTRCDAMGKTTFDGTQKGEHNLVYHPRVEADHYKAGSIAYWECEECGKYFSDSAANNEITYNDTLIDRIPHSYGPDWVYSQTHHWHECSCGLEAGMSEHQWDGGKVTTEPADGKQGVRTFTCEICGAEKRESFSACIVGDLNHDDVVDNMDVEYLLWHTLFPEDYAIRCKADFDGSGSVDNKDVEYLLWHTLFPEDYPL